MNSKALECSKSIQSGKWLQIEYDNTTDQKRTFFWIAIEDIEVPSRRMKVKMFKPEKFMDVLERDGLFSVGAGHRKYNLSASGSLDR